MAEKKSVCPTCGEDAHVFKVSQIYLEALMRVKNKDNAETPLLDVLKSEVPAERTAKMKDADYYRYVVESFAPPQGGAQVIRSINPDWVAVALGLLSIYILYQIYFEQHEMFWGMLAFAVVAMGAYIFFRKQIKLKFEAEKRKESGDKELIERAVGNWMKLYYCSTDNVVFGWKKGDQVPLQEMNSYLLQNSAKK